MSITGSWEAGIPFVGSRMEIGKVTSAMGLGGPGVEVGVANGDYS